MILVKAIGSTYKIIQIIQHLIGLIQHNRVIYIKCLFNDISDHLQRAQSEVSRVQSEVDSVAENFTNEIEQTAVACYVTENSLRVKSI